MNNQERRKLNLPPDDDFYETEETDGNGRKVFEKMIEEDFISKKYLKHASKEQLRILFFAFKERATREKQEKFRRDLIISIGIAFIFFVLLVG